MRYGAEGYALYWYCLELIASRVAPENITFELKHDSEVIGYHLKIDTLRVEKMMQDMIGLGLFEQSGDRIFCLKMAKRLDNTMSQSPQIKETLSNFNSLKADKKRIDKKRIDNKELPPYEDIVKAYHETLPMLPAVMRLSDKRKGLINARWGTSDKTKNIEWWKQFFEKVAESDFLTGKKKDFRADFEWIVNESHFINILEGRYDNR